jgi:GR25 family glycosyltransferase involved in LPS biosynthesis
MKIQEFVDGAFYINLNHRKDKDEFMVNQFNQLGLNNFVERFSAISAFDSIEYRLDDSEKMFLLGRATSLSHKSVVEMAKKRKYKNVLIMEDDAMFHRTNDYHGLDTVEKSLDELKLFENWEILFLGANLHDKELNLVSKHLIKCDCCISTHAYILNEKCYDKILSNNFDKPFDVMDIFLNNNFKEKYIVYPVGVIQKEGNISDIGGHYSFNNQFWLSQYDKPIKKNF